MIVNHAEIDWSNPVVRGHPLNHGLVGWWLAGGPAWGGSRLYDLTGKAHGTRTAGPEWVKGGELGRNGLDYERTNSQYVDMGDPSHLRMTRYSITAWVKPESFANTNCIVTKSNASGGTLRNYNFDIQSTGALRIYHTIAASSFVGCDPGPSTTLGVWQFVAASYDGTRQKIWRFTLAGSQATATNATTSTPSTSTGNCCIGRLGSDNSNYFDGVIDDVRVYNHGIQDSHVNQLFHESRRGYPGILRRVKRTAYYLAPAAGGFQSAWARGSNVLITPGVF